MLLAGSMTVRADIVIVNDSQTTLPTATVESISWTGDFKTGSLIFNFADGQQSAVPFAQIAQLKFAPDAKEETTEEPDGPKEPENPDNPDNPEMPDAIRQARADSLCVSVSGDYLLLKGLADGTPVSILTTAGQRVAHLPVTPCISLHALPAGTYIIKVGHRAVKILKR